MIGEIDYVDECPACGVEFIGMTPEEYRETHAQEDCPKAPYAQLFVFPTEVERRRRGLA